MTNRHRCKDEVMQEAVCAFCKKPIFLVKSGHLQTWKWQSDPHTRDSWHCNGRGYTVGHPRHVPKRGRP
jgi:hypothetical protein